MNQNSQEPLLDLSVAFIYCQVYSSSINIILPAELAIQNNLHAIYDPLRTSVFAVIACACVREHKVLNATREAIVSCL